MLVVRVMRAYKLNSPRIGKNCWPTLYSMSQISLKRIMRFTKPLFFLTDDVTKSHTGLSTVSLTWYQRVC